jgi:hypothetical protein
MERYCIPLPHIWRVELPSPPLEHLYSLPWENKIVQFLQLRFQQPSSLFMDEGLRYQAEKTYFERNPRFAIKLISNRTKAHFVAIFIAILAAILFFSSRNQKMTKDDFHVQSYYRVLFRPKESTTQNHAQGFHN